VADSRTIQHIESKIDQSIGLYEVKADWDIPRCIRRARKNEKIHQINEDENRLAILKKIMYRYYKFNQELSIK